MDYRENQYEKLTTEANTRINNGESIKSTLRWLNSEVNSITLICISKQSYTASDKEEWKDRLEGAEEARDQFVARQRGARAMENGEPVENPEVE